MYVHSLMPAWNFLAGAWQSLFTCLLYFPAGGTCMWTYSKQLPIWQSVFYWRLLYLL